MDKARIEALAALLAKATPGPWDDMAWLLTNPIVWIGAYVLYRVLFTAPGRPPLEEEMTNGH